MVEGRGGGGAHCLQPVGSRNYVNALRTHLAVAGQSLLLVQDVLSGSLHRARVGSIKGLGGTERAVVVSVVDLADAVDREDQGENVENETGDAVGTRGRVKMSGLACRKMRSEREGAAPKSQRPAKLVEMKKRIVDLDCADASEEPRERGSDCKEEFAGVRGCVAERRGRGGLKSGRTSTDPSDGRSPVDSFVVPVHAVGRSVVLVCADQMRVSCLQVDIGRGEGGRTKADNLSFCL